MDRYPIPVMDDNDRLTKWLAQGDTIHAWENEEIASPYGRYAFTRCQLPDGTIASDLPTHACGCERPTWRYGRSPVFTCNSEGAKMRVDGEFPLRIYRKIGTASGFSVHNSTRAVLSGELVRDVKRTEFTDTPAGYRSACNVAAYLNELADKGPRVAPIGRFFQAYTVERLSYESKECRPDGRPLGYSFAQAVIEWSAMEPHPEVQA